MRSEGRYPPPRKVSYQSALLDIARDRYPG
jgi:hypothetical protein